MNNRPNTCNRTAKALQHHRRSKRRKKGKGERRCPDSLPEKGKNKEGSPGRVIFPVKPCGFA